MSESTTSKDSSAEQKTTDSSAKKISARRYIIIVLIILSILFAAGFMIYRLVELKNNYKSNESDSLLEKSEEAAFSNAKQIVANPSEPLPQGMTKSRKNIIKEYLYTCSLLEEEVDRAECIDVYYSNNIPELAASKKICGSDEECLNGYYLEASAWGGWDYCSKISDETLKGVCYENGG